MEKEREQLEELLSRDKPTQSHSYAAVSIIDTVSKNSFFSKKFNFWPKKEPTNKLLIKKFTFDQKLNFWPKNEIWSKIELLAKK